MVRGRPLEVEQELIEAFRRSGQATIYRAGVLRAAMWHQTPPGGRGRSIAGIVAHMQSVRRTFAHGWSEARSSIPRSKVRDTAPGVRRVAASTDMLAELFESALESRQARVKGQPRRLVDMLTYLMQHDAHHRGQICMVARDLGHEFGGEDSMKLWGWKAIR